MRGQCPHRRRSCVKMSWASVADCRWKRAVAQRCVKQARRGAAEAVNSERQFLENRQGERGRSTPVLLARGLAVARKPAPPTLLRTFFDQVPMFTVPKACHLGALQVRVCLAALAAHARLARVRCGHSTLPTRRARGIGVCRAIGTLRVRVGRLHRRVRENSPAIAPYSSSATRSSASFWLDSIPSTVTRTVRTSRCRTLSAPNATLGALAMDAAPSREWLESITRIHSVSVGALTSRIDSMRSRLSPRTFGRISAHLVFGATRTSYLQGF